MQGKEMNIRLNCDMGESFGIWKMGADEQIMPYISLANLACGFHASDPVTMNKSVELACKYNVTIGAHPGYQDLVGFGRRSMACTLAEIKALVLYQVGALSAICKAHGANVAYVKPHGALYNDMMKDENIFKAVLSAISSFDKNIRLMILSKPNYEAYEHTAMLYGISLLHEVFADRNYNDDGSLVSRALPNAVIHDELDVMERMRVLKDRGYMESVNGKKLYLKADTVCVHGDGENALNFVKSLQKVLH